MPHSHSFDTCTTTKPGNAFKQRLLQLGFYLLLLAAIVYAKPSFAAFQVELFADGTHITNLARADRVIQGGRRTTSARTYETIDFYRKGISELETGRFDTGRPFPGALPASFAVRVSGVINIAQAGWYTFGGFTDDGWRLRINRYDVIVDDTLHSPQEKYGSVQLSAGQHRVEVVYFDQGGRSVLELTMAQGRFSGFNDRFKLLNSNAVADTGFNVSTYSNFSQIDDLNQAVQVVNSGQRISGPSRHQTLDFQSGRGSRASHVTATLRIGQAGTYSFAAYTTAGWRLRINGNIVVNADRPSSSLRNLVGSVQLGTGQHRLEMIYFDNRDRSVYQLYGARGWHTSRNNRFELLRVDSFAEAAPVNLEEALISEYRLDEFRWSGEAGEVVDSSSNALHGRGLNGAAPEDTDPALSGNPGTCRYGSFDGRDDYVSIPYNRRLNPISFTASAWVKVEGSAGRFRTVISSRDNPFGSDRMGYILYASNGNYWEFWTGVRSGFNGRWDVLRGPQIVYNQWQHIAISFEANTQSDVNWRGTKRIFINGTQVASTTQQLYQPTPRNDVYIGTGGNDFSSPDYYFNGAIDEVRLYDRALSPAEITQLMNARHECPEPPGRAAFAFNCVMPGQNPINGRLFTRLVGQSHRFDVVALDDSDGDQRADSVLSAFAADAPVTLNVELVDNNSSADCNSRNRIAQQSLTLQSSDQGRRSGPAFTINRAWRHVGCRITDSSDPANPVSACSSDGYAVRPQSLVISSPLNNSTGSGTPSAVAGDAFTLRADSANGYDGRPGINADRIQAHNSAVATGVLGGLFNNANPANGLSSGTDFRYSEVGLFRIDTQGVVDQGFTQIDQASGDCLAGNSNQPNADGKIGCHFGNTSPSPWIGRFTPASFQLSQSNNGRLQASCGSFSFIGEEFAYDNGQAPALTVTALNRSGSVTQNYTGDYNRLAAGTLNIPALTQDQGNKLSISHTLGTPSSLDNGNGTHRITLGDDRFAYTKSTDARQAPFNSDLSITVAEVSDGDGIRSSAPLTLTPSGVSLRFGRIVLEGAHGPATDGLTLGIRNEYFNGSAYVANEADICTSLDSSNVALSNWISPLLSGDSNIAGLSFSGSGGSLSLTAPQNQRNGSVSTTLSVPSHLMDDWDNDGSYDNNPAAQATFGVYKSPGFRIYMREMY